MPWVKLDDQLYQSRKLGKLSANAFRLYIHSLSYAGDHETRGHLPEDSLPYIWPNSTPGARAKAKEELVAVGCWHLNGNGWQIHDFEEYNPPRTPREERESQAGTHAAHVRWHTKKGVVNDECEWCARNAIASESHMGSQSDSSPTAKRFNAPVPDPDPVPDPKDLKNSLSEGLTTPREALRAWAQITNQEPTDTWLNHRKRLAAAAEFLKQHPDLTPPALLAFLRHAAAHGCSTPQGWPDWWASWPGNDPKMRPKPDCDRCGNTRQIWFDEAGNVVAKDDPEAAHVAPCAKCSPEAP